jgi:hypothetical protein
MSDSGQSSSGRILKPFKAGESFSSWYASSEIRLEGDRRWILLTANNRKLAKPAEFIEAFETHPIAKAVGEKVLIEYISNKPELMTGDNRDPVKMFEYLIEEVEAAVRPSPHDVRKACITKFEELGEESQVSENACSLSMLLVKFSKVRRLAVNYKVDIDDYSLARYLIGALPPSIAEHCFLNGSDTVAKIEDTLRKGAASGGDAFMARTLTNQGAARNLKPQLSDDGVFSYALVTDDRHEKMGRHPAISPNDDRGRDRERGRDYGRRGGRGGGQGGNRGGQSGRDNSLCGNCGFEKHPRDECPAKDTVCNYKECGKKGHFARCCKKMKADEKRGAIPSSGKTTGKTFCTEQEGENEAWDDVEEIQGGVTVCQGRRSKRQRHQSTMGQYQEGCRSPHRFVLRSQHSPCC